MKDTFFVPSFGNRPKNLVRREDILHSFDISLDSVPGSRERAVLLLGQRGSGKTVLLLELAEEAAEAGFVVASPTIAANNMTAHIIEKLADAGKEYLPGEIPSSFYKKIMKQLPHHDVSSYNTFKKALSGGVL